MIGLLNPLEQPSLFELAQLPLPSGNLPAGTVSDVVVGTPAAHPSDVVEILFRRNGARPHAIRAFREAGFAHGAVQWFRTRLPALTPGAHDDYRVELSRAGRRIATLPPDGSWYTLRGVEAPPCPQEPPAATPAVTWPSRPRFQYQLEFFAALTVNLRAEILGATPDGYRINFFVKDGHVAGPAIDAVVEPEGGDWMCIRPDGIGAVNIKITYRTRDGALILEEAGGVFDMGPDGYAKVVAGQFEGAPPFYATPKWSTADPKWAWLNRCQGFGIGRVVMKALQVQCDIYIPRVGEPVNGG